MVVNIGHVYVVGDGIDTFAADDYTQTHNTISTVIPGWVKTGDFWRYQNADGVRVK